MPPWSLEGTILTDRQALALAGTLYLLAFPLYGGGQFFLQNQQPFLGLGLVLANTASVIAIGYLLKSIIRRSSRLVASTVLWGRLIEGLVLAAGAVAYIVLEGSQTGQYINEAAYHGAMIILGVAGFIFSAWLFKTRGVPQILAGFGVIGYLSLAAAMVLERLGQDSTSVWFLAAAGVFEILFAFWLIFAGLRPRVLNPEKQAAVR